MTRPCQSQDIFRNIWTAIMDQDHTSTNLGAVSNADMKGCVDKVHHFKIYEYPVLPFQSIMEMSYIYLPNLPFGKLARHLWLISFSTFPTSDNFQNFRAKRNVIHLQLPHFTNEPTDKKWLKHKYNDGISSLDLQSRVSSHITSLPDIYNLLPNASFL